MSLENRYEFVYLFDVTHGNPNGDPDADNLPRLDPETGLGLVTDVSLKRKVRNYVGLAKGEAPPYEIYVKEKAVLNNQHLRAYEDARIKHEPKKLPKKEEEAKKITEWMCHNFYDVRTFGAVMTTEVNAGQVRGPVQLTFARSVEPILTLEHSITRMAVTNERDLEKERTMGRKYTVPYGLYRAHGFVSAHLAEQTGFSDEDLDLLLDALANMFDHDHSAARGEMNCRGLYVFKHDSKLGRAPAHSLLERVRVGKSQARQVWDSPARGFGDFEVTVDDADLPKGVELIRHLG